MAKSETDEKTNESEKRRLEDRLNEITNDRHDSHGNNDLTDNGTVGFDTGKVQESDWNISQITKDLVDDVEGDGTTGVSLVDEVFNFDGINDYMDFGDVMDFEITDTFSIEMWINPTTLATIHSLFVKWNFPVGYGIQIWQSKLLWYMEPTGGQEMEIQGTTAINEGEWQHIVFTYDGSRTAAGVKFHINTTEDSYNILNDDIIGSGGSMINSGNLIMGARDTGTVPFNGKISNVKIYNRALTAQEVTQNYEAQKGFFGL